jgi:DNA-binding beta-propeller fold protein YncE
VLSPDGKRAFIAARGPDTLLVVEISDPLADAPSFNISRGVPLPGGVNQLRVIPRTGRGSLVVATCTDTRTLVVYDEDAGQLVASFNDVGTQPFGLAVDQQGNAARLFVSSFGDGRVAVLESRICSGRKGFGSSPSSGRARRV